MPDDADITETDTQFGRAAQRKQELADELDRQGIDPTTLPEGDGADPRPRAGNKASEGSPSAAETGTDVDEDSDRSFPASDPPANY